MKKLTKLVAMLSLIVMAIVFASMVAACSASPNNQSAGAADVNQLSLRAIHVSGELPEGDTIDTTSCSASACHGDYETRVQSTSSLRAKLSFNPHESHYGDDLSCLNCHSETEQPELYCTTCHEGFLLPDGWAAKPME